MVGYRIWELMFVFALGQADDPLKFMTDLGDTEMSTEIRRYSEGLRRLFSEAHLSVSDPELIALIESAKSSTSRTSKK